MFVKFCLGCDCWVGVTILVASGLLNCCRFCALRLEGKSLVGINAICVSCEGVWCLVVPMFHNCLHLLVLAGTHTVYLVGSLWEAFAQQRCACNLHIINNGMTAAWQHMIGAVFLLADGADWWAFYMVALSGTLLNINQIYAAEHDIFFYRCDTCIFPELLMSFSTMPSLIRSWYFV